MDTAFGSWSVHHLHTKDVAENPTQVFLAVERTRLALERTLMAWVRTAVSLITFGFTLNKAEIAVRAIASNARTHLALVVAFALLVLGALAMADLARGP